MKTERRKEEVGKQREGGRKVRKKKKASMISEDEISLSWMDKGKGGREMKEKDMMAEKVDHGGGRIEKIEVERR